MIGGGIVSGDGDCGVLELVVDFRGVMMTSLPELVELTQERYKQ